MNLSTLHTPDYQDQSEVEELIFNNTFSSYQIGYSQLTAIERDLRDQYNKDHRNYILDFSDL